MEALLVSTSVVALAEIGDKTQLLAMLLAARYRRPLPIILGILVATVALAAAYASFAWVLCGSTLGMMLANVPAVLLGERILRRVRMSWIRAVAAAVFVLMGITALLNL